MLVAKQLVSLIAGIAFVVALASFMWGFAPQKEGPLSGENYMVAERLGELVSECCRKHAGSYRTYNDDCFLLDADITGEVSADEIGNYVPSSCKFSVENVLTGKGKIKITYLGREKTVFVRRIK